MDKWEELRGRLIAQARELDNDSLSVFALEVLDIMDELEIKYVEIESRLGHKPNEYHNGQM